MIFSDLLRKTTLHVNASGKLFSWGVLLGGVILIALQAWMLVQLGFGLLAQLHTMVGDEQFVSIEEQMLEGGIGANDAQELASIVAAEFNRVLEPMSEQERGVYALQFVTGIAKRSGPMLVLIGFLLLCVQLLIRTFFLVLAAHPVRSFLGNLGASFAVLPRLVLVWIGVSLCSGLWIPALIFALGFVQPAVLFLFLPSLIVPIILFPRFAFAPVIAVQEKATFRGSLHRSYDRTRGKWWFAVRNLVGVAVVVWIFASLIQSLLDLLVSSLLPYSIFGFSLYALGAFISLIAMGYRVFSLVALKEGLGHSV